MQKSLPFWQFSGFVFTGVVGTLLHFLYEWLNITVVALFSAVNESVFEHMKLLFFPMFVFSIIESRYFSKYYKNFWQTKLFGTLVGLTVIPTLYYTYTGALGVSADWFNITIFFISAAISYFVETKLLKKYKKHLISSKLAFIILIVIMLAFFIFTFIQPKIPLFQDPVTYQFGM